LATFSVLMPAYNHERYVAEAMESVLWQTFSDLELIVIDDASRDSTPDIIRRYAADDHRVKAHFHTRNRGISATLNEALDLATGRFVAVINSDDLWMPDKLRRQWEVLRDNEDLVVWTEGVLVDAEGRYTGKTFTAYCHAEERKKAGDLFDELVMVNYVLHSSIAAKRETMAVIRYDEDLRYNNDHKLLLDLADSHLYSFLSDALVGYRIHGDNASFHYLGEWDEDYMRLYSYALDRYGGRLRKEKKALLYLYLCRIHDRQGMRSNAVRLLSRALKLDQNPALLYKALNLCDGMRRNEHFWALAPRVEGDRRRAAGSTGAAREAVPGQSASVHAPEETFGSGLEHALRGEHGRALELFEGALRADPDASGAWVNIAIIRSMSGDMKGAMSCLRAALEAGGSEAHAWYNMGVVHDREGRLEEAKGCFERAASLLRGSGNTDMLAAAEMGRGVCLAGMGSYTEAVSCMERASRLIPTDPRPVFNRAFCLEMAERYEEAVRGYEEAARLVREPRWEEMRKGLCLERMGRMREAARCFDRMLQRDPGDDEAWLEKGRNLQSRGEFGKALQCYGKAVKANPKNAEAWRRRGWLLALSGRAGEAADCYREALRFVPRDPEVLEAAGAACLAAHGYEEAEGCFYTALEEEQDSLTSWLGLAACREARGDPEGALECVEEAIVREPSAVEAWNERGNILSRLGALKEARFCYLRALELEQRLPEVWFNLATAEEELGDREACARALRRFIDCAPAEWEEKVEAARRLLAEWEAEEALARRRGV